MLLFSGPPSLNSVAWPFAVSSNSLPPISPYSTTLSVLLTVVHVTSMEPGTPGQRDRVGEGEGKGERKGAERVMVEGDTVKKEEKKRDLAREIQGIYTLENVSILTAGMWSIASCGGNATILTNTSKYHNNTTNNKR